MPNERSFGARSFGGRSLDSPSTAAPDRRLSAGQWRSDGPTLGDGRNRVPSNRAAGGSDGSANDSRRVAGPERNRLGARDFERSWSGGGQGNEIEARRADGTRRSADYSWSDRRSPREVIPADLSRPERPASIGGDGQDRVRLGDMDLSVDQLSDYFRSRSRYGYGGGRGDYNSSLGFGVGFGLGVAAANWSRYWYDYYLPSYHRSWYRGTWASQRFGVGYVPWIYSYSNWGYTPLAYRMGYVQYVNPYCVDTLPISVYDYREPIIVERPVYVEDSGDQQALDLLNAALDAFRATDYRWALQQVDASLRMNANDPVAHELRALTLFALGRYTDAAATLHALLAAAPGWDWPTMRGLYPSTAIYTEQLRALEAYRNAHPQSADARFVLAYHYLVAGHLEAAQGQLQRVVALEPRDQVAAQILEGLWAAVEPRSAAVQTRVRPAEPTGPSVEALPRVEIEPVDAQQAEVATPLVSLPGRWRAEPQQGVVIHLVMNEDSSFTWTATRGEETTVIEGQYSVNGPLLILEGADGGAMLARLVPEHEHRFQFVMLGSPEGDPGLRFDRQP